jgi:hypothetical protein
LPCCCWVHPKPLTYGKEVAAVQWLIENAKGFHNAESSKAMQEEALRMGRERIIDAFDDGQSNHCLPRDYENGKQYYTQTFKP